ncbi:unnamed protein product [Ilex paraguariensis]|uniref:EGF-like domain-containing protein n=1 Tax=Ilex paraguariensis TaxID=185542 RepID=A0ABC8R1W9_9AQUA
MRLGTDAKTGESTLLTSWKSPSDPSTGTFFAGVDPLIISQFFVWNDSHPYWRSGPWNGQVFIGIPIMHKLYGNGINLVDDNKGTVDLTFSSANEFIVLYLQLNSEASLPQKHRFVRKEDWNVSWWAPKNECDVYGKCGPFGSCNSVESPICTCLRGFKPKHMDEWSRGNWSSGCKRKTPLQCYSRIGCMQWSGSLIDIQKFSDGGADLYIRVAYSELGNMFRHR